MYRRVEVARLLLQSTEVDADVAHDGYTVLIQAAEKGNADLMRMLLDSGKVDCNRGDNNSWTPLISAAHDGQVTMPTNPSTVRPALPAPARVAPPRLALVLCMYLQ